MVVLYIWLQPRFCQDPLNSYIEDLEQSTFSSILLWSPQSNLRLESSDPSRNNASSQETHSTNQLQRFFACSPRYISSCSPAMAGNRVGSKWGCAQVTGDHHAFLAPYVVGG